MHGDASSNDSRARPVTARDFAALLVGNATLALGPWLVRVADVGPVAAGFWRLALALPVLVAAAAWTARSSGRGALTPCRAPWGLLATGGLFFAADLAAWHAGILHTRLANATLFGNVASFTFPLYGYLIARAWPGRNQLIALILAAAGVALLLGRSFELSPRNLFGDALALAAGLFYTVYLVAIDRVRGRIAPVSALAASTAAGTLPLLAAALLLGERVWPQAWGPLIGLALGSQLLGQGLLVYAIGRLSPVVVGLALLTQPVIAATIGWIAYGERLGAIDLIGATAIAVALVLVRRERRSIG